jgi:hypothetical protein
MKLENIVLKIGYIALLIVGVLLIASAVASFVYDLPHKSQQIADADVIKHICGRYKLPFPESISLSKNLELKYNKANRYYTFVQDSKGEWWLCGGGYIKPPLPAERDVAWELYIGRMFWEAEKRKYREQRFDPTQEKPKPWVEK